MNVWDIVILILLGCALVLALRSGRRARRGGCCADGCRGCSGCSDREKNE